MKNTLFIYLRKTGKAARSVFASFTARTANNVSLSWLDKLV